MATALPMQLPSLTRNVPTGVPGWGSERDIANTIRDVGPAAIGLLIIVGIGIVILSVMLGMGDYILKLLNSTGVTISAQFNFLQQAASVFPSAVMLLVVLVVITLVAIMLFVLVRVAKTFGAFGGGGGGLF